MARLRLALIASLWFAGRAQAAPVCSVHPATVPAGTSVPIQAQVRGAATLANTDVLTFALTGGGVQMTGDPGPNPVTVNGVVNANMHSGTSAGQINILVTGAVVLTGTEVIATTGHIATATAGDGT